MPLTDDFYEGTAYLLTGCGAVTRGLAVDGHTTRRAPQLRTQPHRRIDVGDLERSTNASTDARVADPANANSPGVSQRGIKRRGWHRSAPEAARHGVFLVVLRPHGQEEDEGTNPHGRVAPRPTRRPKLPPPARPAGACGAACACALRHRALQLYYGLCSYYGQHDD